LPTTPELGQYLSIRYTERLAEAGIERSVGSVGDSYDNALAETMIGLYKTEVIRCRGPWRSIDAVGYATLEWVDWFNRRRLLEPLGYLPPAEFEAAYYRGQESPALGGWTPVIESPENPGRFIPASIATLASPVAHRGSTLTQPCSSDGTFPRPTTDPASSTTQNALSFLCTSIPM
jgi:hypothetical protein